MSLASSIAGRLARLDDGKIIRAAFFGMLAATAAILYFDYRDLVAGDALAYAPADQPILPAFDPDSPDAPPGPAVTTDPQVLQQPLAVALGSGGVLSLTGTLDPGSAARVQAEIDAHGEYITSVALDSPGGSVTDALAIGQLIRDKGYSTSVAAGAFCASSCPLILAGGRARLATAQSAIGVHQIYAATRPGTVSERLEAAGNVMSDAQKMTAFITRYLTQMGIDPELWLHALETPPERLYYLSPDELMHLKLVTKITR